MGTAYLKVTVSTAEYSKPIAGATVVISQNGSDVYRTTTDADGNTGTFEFSAPDKDVTLDPYYTGEYYSNCDVVIEAEGFPTKRVFNVMLFDTVTTLLPEHLTPEPAQDEEYLLEDAANPSGAAGIARFAAAAIDPAAEEKVTEPDNLVELPVHPLVSGAERNPEYTEMPRSRILPEVVVPNYIIVHLGKKDDPATNISVQFRYYIKNVCSHEIFPTWPTNAIIANIHCQVSLALNRIYTEFYRSQGYPFDITSSTWTDQNFVYQGEIFPNISVLVDEYFDTYAHLTGHSNPFYTEYCDGIKADCAGLKQWGTVDLAEEGYSPIQMLRYYYGSNIVLTESENIADVEQSYPGYTLIEGASGPDVLALQNYLNRIRVNYPTIPQITDPDGVYGPQTAAAVKAFKAAANWPMESYSSAGTVDKATWYNISYAYYAVKKLAQLASEGEVIGIGRTPPNATTISEGSRGTHVGQLQYILNVIADFYPEVRSVIQDYNFGAGTTNSVMDFQKAFQLTQDGGVGPGTWKKLYEVYWKIIDEGLMNPSEPPTGGLPAYPGSSLTVGSSGSSVLALQKCLNNISNSYPAIPKLTEDGKFGNGTRSAVIAFQHYFGITADGIVGPTTWSRIGQICAESGGGTPMPSYPGFVLREGANGDYVKQVQRCLNNISNSYPSIAKLTEDGVYGSVTAKSVIAFQKIFGLTSDGAVGPATWAKLMEECQSSDASKPAYPGYLISVGSSGNYVKQIQQCINNVAERFPSIPTISTDGVFGNGTKNAVTAFQRQFGLTADGIVGKTTWEKLLQECTGIETRMASVNGTIKSGGCAAVAGDAAETADGSGMNTGSSASAGSGSSPATVNRSATGSSAAAGNGAATESSSATRSGTTGGNSSAKASGSNAGNSAAVASPAPVNISSSSEINDMASSLSTDVPNVALNFMRSVNTARAHSEASGFVSSGSTEGLLQMLLLMLILQKANINAYDCRNYCC